MPQADRKQESDRTFLFRRGISRFGADSTVKGSGTRCAEESQLSVAGEVVDGVYSIHQRVCYYQPPSKQMFEYRTSLSMGELPNVTLGSLPPALERARISHSFSLTARDKQTRCDLAGLKRGRSHPFH